jgi:hypothetical protein
MFSLEDFAFPIPRIASALCYLHPRKSVRNGKPDRIQPWSEPGHHLNKLLALQQLVVHPIPIPIPSKLELRYYRQIRPDYSSNLTWLDWLAFKQCRVDSDKP